MVYSYCYVPGCTSSSIKTPEKYFFSLPKDIRRKVKWIHAIRRSPKDLSFKTQSLNVCQDHFNLEEDLENYIKFTLKGGKKHRLKPHVVPHIFGCQPDGSLTHSTKRRSLVEKRQLKGLFEVETPKASRASEEQPEEEIFDKSGDNPSAVEKTHDGNLTSISSSSIASSAPLCPRLERKELEERIQGYNNELMETIGKDAFDGENVIWIKEEPNESEFLPETEYVAEPEGGGLTNNSLCSDCPGTDALDDVKKEVNYDGDYCGITVSDVQLPHIKTEPSEVIFQAVDHYLPAVTRK